MFPVSLTINDREYKPLLSPVIRQVRKWGDPVMVEYGFDVNQVGSTNFQAVKCFNDGDYTFGGVTAYIRINRDEINKLQALQRPDEFGFSSASKMEWLCSFRGSIYMYEGINDSWQTAPTIRWGTITLGGNLVQILGYRTFVVGGELIRMARLATFEKSDWNLSLDTLLAQGKVHRCYCAYKNNQFGDSPKGIVYSPLFSPKNRDFAGTAEPNYLYIPEVWLESV